MLSSTIARSNHVFSCRSDIAWCERTGRGTRSTGTWHGGAILVTEATVTVVVIDVDLISVDLSFFVSLVYESCVCACVYMCACACACVWVRACKINEEEWENNTAIVRQSRENPASCDWRVIDLRACEYSVVYVKVDYYPLCVSSKPKSLQVSFIRIRSFPRDKHIEDFWDEIALSSVNALIFTDKMKSTLVNL